MKKFGQLVAAYKSLPDMGGEQYLFRFINGLGASVVKHEYSYGSKQDLWELALIEWTGATNDEWELFYNDYFSDVRGWQNDKDVAACLKLIKSFTVN